MSKDITLKDLLKVAIETGCKLEIKLGPVQYDDEKLPEPEEGK